MRILFDGSTLSGRDGGPGAGIEHYSSSLLLSLANLFPQDDFFVASSQTASKDRWRSVCRSLKNVHFLRNFPPPIPLISRHVLLPVRSLICKPDLFFSPHGQLPIGWRGKSVVTVHDVSVFEHPEWFTQELSQSFTTRFVVPFSFQHATKMICVSAWTQSRLHQVFPFTENKTTVVYEGVELGNEKTIENTDRFPFDRDYLLCLGTIEPRKNLVRAFEAFDQFLQIHPELVSQVRLIVAGRHGWKTTDVDDAACAINQTWKSLESSGVIHFLGPVTEEEKWYLLSQAAGLLFPSHEEGFGLPILEAMSVGTPVITTKNSALEEVAGDAAMVVDCEDVQSMSLAIAQCILVPQGLQPLREDGYRRAKNFSWDRTAKETMDVFRLL